MLLKKYGFETILFLSIIIAMDYIGRKIKVEDLTKSLKWNKNSKYGNTTKGEYWKRDLSKIKQGVLHHTATPSSWTPERINELHMNERGWPRIGYHRLIYPDGRIFLVNDLDTVSYHVKDQNTMSVGYAMVMNASEKEPTERQLAALLYQVKKDEKEMGKPFERFIGHGEAAGNKTECPGSMTDLDSIRELLKIGKYFQA